MKTFSIFLLAFLMGLVSISASDNQKAHSVSDRQSKKMVTIEEILYGIKKATDSFNISLYDLTVKQTTTLKSTLMGEAKIVKQISFKRPDIIEQTDIEREENLRSGVTMKLDESISYTLFTESLLSSLSPDDYNINLIGKKTLNERPAYLLKVKSKDKEKDYFDGELWIDASDFTLIRYEGKPLQKEDDSNVSGGKQIIEYSKIGEKFWLPVLNRRKATWVLLIKLVNEITYSEYMINTILYKAIDTNFIL